MRERLQHLFSFTHLTWLPHSTVCTQNERTTTTWERNHQKLYKKKAHTTRIHTSHRLKMWRRGRGEISHSEVTLNNFAQDANSTETVKVKHCMTTSIFYEELHTHKTFFWCARARWDDTNKHPRITHECFARGAHYKGLVLSFVCTRYDFNCSVLLKYFAGTFDFHIRVSFMTK